MKRFSYKISLVIVIFTVVGGFLVAHATSPVILPGPAPWIPEINMILTMGSVDARTAGQVSDWQTFLVIEEKGPAAMQLRSVLNLGAKKGYFGNLTAKATVEWQTTYGISPTYPATGPKTRAKLAELRKPSPTGSLKLLTPNGGETLIIGKPYTFRWESSATFAPKFVEIALIGGPTPGVIATSNTVPASASGAYTHQRLDTVRQDDIAYQLKAGSYKARILFYDGVPCGMICPPESANVKVIAQDESDAVFQIVVTPSY